MMKHLQILAVLALALLLDSSGSAAPCPNVGVSPQTFPEGVKVRPYSMTNFATIPPTQEICIFLQNVTLASIPAVSVDSQMEEPGAGVPGPWPLVSSSSINISGGVSVTCSTSGSVATTAATFGSLAPGAATDICCFVLEEDPQSQACGGLPAAGDVARHTFVSGSVVLMPVSSYIPVGGTTCGLISLELLLIVPLVRVGRGRARS